MGGDNMRSEEQLKEMIHECWDSLEVKKCISRGNFGVVFRCTGGGKAYARDLAVKVVERDFGEDDRINAEDAGLSFDEYFQKKENAARQEIALMVEGQGSHIMPVHNYAIKEEPDKSAFYVLIVMEKMDDDIRKTARNAALWQNLDRTKKPETQGRRDAEAYAVRLANHILTALTVLQNRKDPILHRDIKPANLFLRKIDPAKEDGGCENYDFYLGDFGIARILDDMVTNVTTAGTQVYMAPELIRGKADESSDLYSLGIILYQIVNHWRTPFMSGTGAKENIQQEAYVRRMQAEEIPAPDGCSPEFAKFILKLCRYDPFMEELESCRTAGKKIIRRIRGKLRRKIRALWHSILLKTRSRMTPRILKATKTRQKIIQMISCGRKKEDIKGGRLKPRLSPRQS